MRIGLALAVGLWAITVGATLPPGDHDLSLSHGGRTRTYLVHVPPAAGTTPVPVVLCLHGAGGNALGMKDWSGLDRIADREGFIAVYPDGTGPIGRRFLTWNAGTCCGYAERHQVDDVGFVRALLTDLGRQVAVDPSRVYVTGLSNGAMMSYRLAAEAADVVAAIAPVAGGAVTEAAAPERPVPVMHFHSVDDPRALFTGGLGPLLPFFRRVEHPAVTDTLARWIRFDGCPAEPETVTVRRGTLEPSHTATELRWAPCRAGSEVVLWRLTGAGHVWPGASARYPEWFVGPATHVVDANEEMWRFFQRFKRADAPPLVSASAERGGLH